MGQPLFFLQIVDGEGRIARFPGGGPLEANFIDICLQHILPKGVGLFRTKDQVEQAIRSGLAEAIMSLKSQTVVLVK